MEETNLLYKDATCMLASFIDIVTRHLIWFNLKLENTTSTCVHAMSTKNVKDGMPKENGVLPQSVIHVEPGDCDTKQEENVDSSSRTRHATYKKDREYSSRPKSVDVDILIGNKKNSKKGPSYVTLKRTGEISEDNRKHGGLIRKLKSCCKMEKRTGKFIVFKERKLKKQQEIGALSTSIIGFYGIWSLRNY